MSGAANQPQSAAQRFVVAAKARSLAIPRGVLAFTGVCSLIVLGMVANNLVQSFVNPQTNTPDTPPSNQIRVGAPTTFQMPQDTTAPSREPSKNMQAAPPATKVAQTPTPTAVQTIGNAVGLETMRPVLLQPDDNWAKIGTGPQSQRTPVDTSTPAERAAAAFGEKPAATKLASSRATAINDPTRTIRPGTRLFCTTQEAIDTTVGAGSFVCDVDRWVQAWDGVTPLIPPHSWVLVTYQELKNGRNRIFAASGVLTTPDNVVVSLGDPFGMPDGSAGVEGVVQDNTLPRLKEGLILDFAQSLFQTGENLASRSNQGNGNSNFNFNMSTNNTQQAVERTLEKNLNIPDVLRLPEGAHLSMTIIHPVFFQDVVGFTMRAGAR